MDYTDQFDVKKYLGTWYELMHYPSWFQRNDNYNTKAIYILKNSLNDIKIEVRNSTISNGIKFESIGEATYMGNGNFIVDFKKPDMYNINKSSDFSEINKLYSSGEFNMPSETEIKSMMGKNKINYVIDHLWLDKDDNYIFSIVTDPTRNSLYVLSRDSNPSMEKYSDVMRYVIKNFDRDKLVQTPHFY